MYLTDVSVRRVQDITETLWGTRVSPSAVSDLNKKIYVLTAIHASENIAAVQEKAIRVSEKYELKLLPPDPPVTKIKRLHLKLTRYERTRGCIYSLIGSKIVLGL